MVAPSTAIRIAKKILADLAQLFSFPLSLEFSAAILRIIQWLESSDSLKYRFLRLKLYNSHSCCRKSIFKSMETLWIGR